MPALALDDVRVTFVSPDEAFVLGTAPCAHTPCTSIVRTLNRGASWRGLPAPVVPLSQPENGPASAVWGIRFATPSPRLSADTAPIFPASVPMARCCCLINGASARADSRLLSAIFP